MKIKIYKSTVEKLPIPETGYNLVWDIEISGFGVRVTHTGVKSFVLQKRINGVNKRLTVVCTVYDSIPEMSKEALTALKFFNEVLLLETFAFGLPVIDLRLCYDDAADYSNVSPIEPSSQGGYKISTMIE